MCSYWPQISQPITLVSESITHSALPKCSPSNISGVLFPPLIYATRYLALCVLFLFYRWWNGLSRWSNYLKLPRGISEWLEIWTQVGWLRHYNALLRQQGERLIIQEVWGSGEKGFPAISLEPKVDFENSASVWPKREAWACSSRSNT